MKIYSYHFSNLAYYRRRGNTEQAEKAYEKLMARIQKLKKGDQIELGEYLLPGGCKPNDVKIRMPISWFVIHQEGSKLLLLSSYCLDWDFFDGSGPFFGPAADTQWSQSDIRKWLNGAFYDSAFQDQEKRMILETEVRTADNVEYQTKGGAVTRDKLFLLSAEEAGDYLKGSELAACEILYADGSMDEEKETATLSLELHCWWLRTPGGDQNRVSVVCENGAVDLYGIYADADEVGIRPAMWIDVNRMTE